MNMSEGPVPSRIVRIYKPISMVDWQATQELASEGPQIISKDTSNKLRHELNLLVAQPIRVGHAGQRLAENTFRFLKDNDQGTFNLLYEWLGETYEETPEIEGFDRMDAATMGMSIVLEAFSLQYGPGFYEGLKGVTPAIKERALKKLPDEDKTILGRVSREDSGIEPFQTHLGGVIDDFERYVGFPNDMKEGASRAYGLVRASWKSMKLDG